MKTDVIIFTTFYGKAIITIDQNQRIESGIPEISHIFIYKLGKRLFEQYADGCTHFKLSDNQIMILKKELKIK